jgi:hypothetical protein
MIVALLEFIIIDFGVDGMLMAIIEFIELIKAIAYRLA